ncbi:PPOX class F420-dependent oxidoreductase [Streptomyces sp. NBC_01304]|uniref:PPOX class F420-dependent oxidoreductase n=1 Tax=Streptomyces sp. NBC_01304 TaxID=2903818 RepID=UPI002E154456|nr:PPOX class F420-dependent oxidoreductase [Streptomyces sp. NBC_01304]
MTNPSESPSPALVPFVKQYAVLLTSHKKDGSGVGTPVNIAVEGDHAYFRTYGKSWKVKRMRNNPEVEICPSTMRGVQTGPEIKARVRLLDRGGEEERRARRAILRKYPVMHGFLVPLSCRIRRDRPLHYEVRVLGE